MTDENGSITAVYDYYPFGGSRIAQEVNSEIDYLFTGQEYDEETDQHYFNARYYEQEVGRFNRVDPLAFKIAMVSNDELKKLTGMYQQKLLENPQALNSYAYAVNNPIKYVDPNGEWWKEFFTGQQSFSSLATEVGQAAQYLYDNSSIWQKAMDNPVKTGIITGVASGLAALGASAGITYGLTELGIIGTQADNVKNVANNLKLGQRVEGFGEVIENTAGKINSFIRPNAGNPFHGLDRAVGRDVTTEAILNTVKNPLATFLQGNGSIYRLTQEAAVVLDKAGNVVTTYGRSDFYPKVINLLETITK